LCHHNEEILEAAKGAAEAAAARAAAAVGPPRCTLTPPDPQQKGAWYPGGFNPRTYQVKNPVSKCAFQVHNLHRYTAEARENHVKQSLEECTLAGDRRWEVLLKAGWLAHYWRLALELGIAPETSWREAELWRGAVQLSNPVYP
jgi:hypothetical protein